jgi:Predicted hydrolases or acyltransferases (alpha/beta hydrolase superfamily)
MAKWLPYETIEIPTRFGITHINACGLKDAPPLVLIHAMGVTSTMWLPNVDVLGRQYRIYALDTIGDIGKSILTNMNHYPKNGRAYSEWLGDVYDGLGIAKASVISASMGGWIAMNMAIFKPERVNRLVLLGPMGLRLNLEVFLRLFRLMIKADETNKKSLIQWILGENQVVKKEFTEYMLIATNCKGRLGNPLKISGSRLKQLKTPTLLFLGGEDKAIGAPEKAAFRARKFITNLEVEILSESGHLMSYEQPEAVNRRILTFLSQ